MLTGHFFVCGNCLFSNFTPLSAKTSSIFCIFVILFANGMLFFLYFYRSVPLNEKFPTFHVVSSRRRILECAQPSILLH